MLPLELGLQCTAVESPLKGCEGFVYKSISGERIWCPEVVLTQCVWFQETWLRNKL